MTSENTTLVTTFVISASRIENVLSLILLWTQCYQLFKTLGPYLIHQFVSFVFLPIKSL